MDNNAAMIRVPPFHYIHVLDNNTNTRRVEVGPQTFHRHDHEKVIKSSTRHHILPPYSYCIVQNPYIRKDEETKEPLCKDGQVMLRYGENEIRFWDEWKNPFPLLPGESVSGTKPLDQIAVDSALRLFAKRDFEVFDEETKKTIKRVAGDEWLLVGPTMYRPRVDVEIRRRILSQVIEPNYALLVKATKSCIDSKGNERKSGEQWLIREAGTYLPSVWEEVIENRRPYIITDTKALHIQAINSYKDVYGFDRKAGDEWLITKSTSVIHIQDIHERIISPNVPLRILQEDEYCIVLDPIVKGKNMIGTKKVRNGACSFFLYPGERLEGKGIVKVHILRTNQALLLKAQESFIDEEGQRRNAGDMWLILGPRDYTPRVEIQVIEQRSEIPMAANEGIYVQNLDTGEVRTIRGQSYMLEAHEQLWNKELPKPVEQQISHRCKIAVGTRDKSKLVTFPVSYNSAVQIFDYKLNKSRVVFGPDMVALEPDEEFTIMSLSGDTPKRAHVITTLEIRLGPDFMSDIIELETTDHARLKVHLSYNWYFKIEREDESKIFQVKDFIGDACKALGSRVRASVASITFDEFHKNSARLIRKAVFGETDDTKKIRDSLTFSSNNLRITNVDIRSVEPIDERTRESLQKSVQLAIEITTKKQERRAKFGADEIEQRAKSELDCQKIKNQKSIEEEKQHLVEQQVKCKTIEATGQATAEAKGRDTKLRIEADMSVEQAKLAVQASKIETTAELNESKQTRDVEIAHNNILVEMAMKKARRLSEIETNKFSELVNTIQPTTIQEIARSGPEMQARLLKGLGLKGYLMTDGNSPINLFNAAKGMVAGPNMN